VRYASPGLFETLARKLARFAEDNSKAAADARPHLPEALNDRAQDNWELLVAIAEVAGGEWPQKAREAALVLSGGAEPDDSARTQLLADIRSVFEEKECERITSEALVGALNGMPDRPWAECNHGKELTQNGLARRLKAGIRSKNVRIGGLVPKCYEASDFAESFARYLDPPFQPATSATSNKFNDVDENQTATRENVVADGKRENYNEINAVAVVADENPLPGEMDEDFVF
jgi:putative DNA primase/helicase